MPNNRKRQRGLRQNNPEEQNAEQITYQEEEDPWQSTLEFTI